MTDFHELYSMHAKDIYNFALFLCGNAMEAEDITAETFARVLTGKTPLISNTVKGYLLTIARNLYLDSQRKRKKWKELSPEINYSISNLEENVDNKSKLEDLMNYLQSYPEIDRSALLLRSDGFSYFDISKILDISLASAKVKVHRLRLKLAEWRTKRDEE